MIDFLGLAFQVASDTVTYLMAWWGVPVWAFLAAVLLLWWGRGRAVEEWALSESAPKQAVGAFLLALARPGGATEMQRKLTLLRGRAGGTGVYLAASHCLTVYYFFLLGPLLGKDVLLSHVIGGVAFTAFVWAASRTLGLAGPHTAEPGVSRGDEAASSGGEQDASEPAGLSALGLRELARFVGYAGWGLTVGGLIGALGLSDPSLLLTELPLGDGLVRQIAHAALGVAAASLTFMWPVATLFAGTYLWKVGLAHAGLVAFFYGATVAPQRIGMYRRVWGAARARKWTAVLALGAALAGLFTAVFFGLTGLDIHYRLVPTQLWRP